MTIKNQYKHQDKLQYKSSRGHIKQEIISVNGVPINAATIINNVFIVCDNNRG